MDKHLLSIHEHIMKRNINQFLHLRRILRTKFIETGNSRRIFPLASAIKLHLMPVLNRQEYHQYILNQLKNGSNPD